MIISRTPFRISFLGGGTDYPAWFQKHGGAVLATSIDKYCYISCRHLPPFFEYKHKISYSKIEYTPSITDIKHPAIKTTLEFMKIKKGLEINYQADLPARAGLGTSSSFTVGLLHTLQGLQGKMISKKQLASDAIHVEQNLIKENVGSQDQITTAYGGLNKVEFHQNGDFQVKPLPISYDKRKRLEEHLMLFFTGFTRIASDIAQEQIKKTPDRKKQLTRMYTMVDEGLDILNDKDDDLTAFGRLLHEAWAYKRSLTNRISNSELDTIYEKARTAGAIGGKLLGAGGGGFMLFFVEPEKQKKVKSTLKHLLHVPFHFETEGSSIIYYSDKLDEEMIG